MPRIKTLVFWGMTLLLLLFFSEAALRFSAWVYHQFHHHPARRPYSPPAPHLHIRDFLGNRSQFFRQHNLKSVTKTLPGVYIIGEEEGLLTFRLTGRVVSKEKAAGTYRIVCLGDACTYGLKDPDNYPRELERRLRERGYKVEVLNASNPDFTAEDLQLYTPFLLTYHPDLVTVYIGWNNLEVRPEPTGWEKIFKTLYLGRVAADYFLGWLNNRSPRYYRESVGYRYRPAFLKALNAVIEPWQKAGVKVALLTLPGRLSGNPREDRTQIDRCYDVIGNGYTLARRTAAYNQCLRELAASRSLSLVDLEAWGTQALLPRDAYFLNSQRLNAEGYRKIGEYLAQCLAPLLPRPVKEQSLK